MKTLKRPIYETKDDLRGEGLTCSSWANSLGLAVNKLPMSYELDFLLTSKANGKAVALLEYKRRHSPVDRFPTVMLSLKKVMRGCELSSASGLPSLFLVQFDDGIGSCCFTKFSKRPGWIQYGGRTTRTRDAGDIEPVVMIPISEFDFWG